MIATIKDGIDSTDCSSSMTGSTLVTCRYSGSAWVAFGSGNVSGPGGATPHDVPYFSDTTGTSLADSGITYTSIPGSGSCSNKAVTGLNGGQGPTCSTITSAYVDTTICSDGSCMQNTTGTASNLSGTPMLPNGTTAVTQSIYAGDIKLATDSYVDSQTKPLFSTAVTGLSMSPSAGTVLSGPTTMVASPTTGTYRLNFQIVPTTAGGGLCSEGAVAISLGYKDADTGGVISVGTGGTMNENILFYPLDSGTLTQTVSFNHQTVGTVATVFTGVARDIRVASNTAITYQVWQVSGSNCAPTPLFTVRPAVWYLGY